MGKADKKEMGQAITAEQKRSQQQGQSNIDWETNRINTLTPRSDTERSSVFSGYQGLQSGAGGRSREEMMNFLSGGGAGGTGGGGGGGGGGAGSPSYMDVYGELAGKQGGFDPARLGRIEGAAGKLYDTSGNYGDTNAAIQDLLGARGKYGATEKAVGGLQDFAKTGGLDPGDLEGIQRGYLQDVEKTGGYSPTDIQNIRARSNAAIASNYQANRDAMNRAKIQSGQLGPGWSEAGFKLARQGAQEGATNARNTELDIGDTVRAARMDASKTLASNNLQLQGLKNQARLQGYGTSGQLDVDKNRAIQDAMTSAGRMGLDRQAQIDAAMEAAAGIEQGNQQMINQTRLSAAGGLQSADQFGRSMGASGAANDAANRRFILEQEQQDRMSGLQGMLGTYGATPDELLANQNLLRGYGQDVSEQQQGLIDQLYKKATLPGWTQGFANIMGGIGSLAGGIGGLMTGGLTNIAGGALAGLGGKGGGGQASPGMMGSSGYHPGNPNLSYMPLPRGVLT